MTGAPEAEPTDLTVALVMTSLTVALVMTWSGLAMGNWPSPRTPEKMRISLARSLPSGPRVPPEAIKSPGLMSARVRLALKVMVVLESRAAVATVPSASFMVTVLPSKDWTTPATGGLAGGPGRPGWASVGAAVMAVMQIVARN